MGSTFLAVLFRDGDAFWAHTGDSRFCVFREDLLIRITEDQTLARFLVKEGEITPEQAKSHYSRQVMDQCVGCGYCEPETGCFELAPGDLAILCTDGLFKSVNTELMVSSLSRSGGIDRLADSLVRAALENGGRDNITVIGIRSWNK